MVGDTADDLAQVSFGIDAVKLGGLCRAPNYAEQSSFPLHLL